ncbi:MAG: tetratricopeptide repeat protein [Chitinophagaceae bacterium]|nr:tetratricopeptide repeat protein [Chitinophagaceae bacterium]
MKKLITLFFLVAGMLLIAFGTANAQSNNTVIAKAPLANIKNPLERFTATIKFLENADTGEGDAIDSALCIDLQKMATQLKNDSLLAISYNWIYAYFNAKGRANEAIEYLYKALPLAEKYNDKRRISSIYFDLAGTYAGLGKKTEAIDFLKKGGENLPDKTSPMYDYMLVQYQTYMAFMFLANKQLDSALYYAQISNQTAERLNNNLYKFQTLRILAGAYEEKKEPEIANVYRQKAMAVAQLFKGNLRKFEAYNAYVGYLIRADSLKEATVLAQKMWIIAQQEQNQGLILGAATAKRTLYDKLNKTDSAYYYAKVEIETRKLVFDEEKLSGIQAMGLKEQLRKMDEAAKDEEVKQQRKQNIQYIFLAIGIVTFLILFFLLSRSIVVTEKWISFFGILGLLIVFEFINLLIHPFLERVTHHNPMLMLLALVALASLLIPLHHRLEKWIKEKMTDKNKKIRLASAKKTIEELEGKR